MRRALYIVWVAIRDSMRGIARRLGFERRRSFSYGIRQQVFRSYNGHCAYCKRSLRGAEWHVDHLYPWSRGGSDELSNLVAACAPCNLRKGAKTL